MSMIRGTTLETIDLSSLGYRCGNNDHDSDYWVLEYEDPLALLLLIEN